MQIGLNSNIFKARDKRKSNHRKHYSFFFGGTTAESCKRKTYSNANTASIHA
jgi:hypothetical protein